MFNNPLSPRPAEKSNSLQPKGAAAHRRFRPLGLASALLLHKATQQVNSNFSLLPHCFCVSLFPPAPSHFISCLLIYGIAGLSGHIGHGFFMVLYTLQLSGLHCCSTPERLNCKLPHIVQCMSPTVTVWLEDIFSSPPLHHHSLPVLIFIHAFNLLLSPAVHPSPLLHSY